MRPAGRLILLLIAVLAATLASAHAEKRVALVIGNAAYQNIPRLDNASADAQLMAETLKSVGFTLSGGRALLDLDKRGFDEAVQAFGKAAQGADVAMFFYAGHGVQVRGANYLVPVNANPTREADVDFQMLDVGLVLNQLQGSGTRLNMVILDACRNNPFGGRGLRAAGGGLAQIRAPEGTLISYATQPGNVAQDGDDGHSPYTRALATALRQPGLDVFQTFNSVGLAVKRSTGGAQQPWVSSSPIDGTFYFVPPSQPAVASPPPAGEEDQRVEPLRNESRAAAAEQNAPVTDCDRLAANPADPMRAPGVEGVRAGQIDIVPALAACNLALKQYPSVARFAYQAGRVAQAQKDYATARQFYEKAAHAGYGLSYLNLGALYAQGNGAPKDYAEARRWYEKAAQVNSAGVNALGYLFEQGHGAPKDPVEARRLYEKAAAAGSVAAMNNLARLYREGSGVAKDPVQSRQWLEKASALNDPAAMNSIGFMLEQGLGAPKDLQGAQRWYEKAAAAGSLTAMNNLGRLYRDGAGVAKDPAQARGWFEKAAAANDAAAANSLGIMYETGNGLPKDPAEARRWYDKAVTAGSNAALSNLGRLHRDGLGGPQDAARAKMLFERAAAAGDGAGMRQLGYLYEKGTGVAADPAQALRWYEKGVATGDTGSMNSIGHLYEEGIGLKKDLAQARIWYEKAAHLGDAIAMSNLGRFCRDGLGGPKDLAQARIWFEKAAAGGRSWAMARLGELYEQGLGVAKDPAAARRWYELAAAAGDTGAAKAVERLAASRKGGK